MYICTCMLRGGEASPRGEGEVKPPPRGWRLPPQGGRRRSLPPVGGTPPQGGDAPPPKNGKKCTPPKFISHPPKKKIFTPPKKSKKFLLNKEAKPRQWGLGEIFQVKICLRRFVFEIFAKNKKSDLSAYKV